MFEDICPCKDCVPPKRTPTCHPECKEYNDWIKARREFKEYIEVQRQAEKDYNSVRLNKRRRDIWEQSN